MCIKEVCIPNTNTHFNSDRRNQGEVTFPMQNQYAKIRDKLQDSEGSNIKDFFSIPSSLDGLLLIIGEGVLGEATNRLALVVKDIGNKTAG